MTTQLPASTVVNENSNIDLTCESKGYPKGVFKWYKGAVEMKHDGSKYFIQYSLKSLENGIISVKSVLTVLKVNRNEEGDRYKCKVRTSVNEVESSTQLAVRCKYMIVVAVRQETHNIGSIYLK